jgi:hypothetical protein
VLARLGVGDALVGAGRHVGDVATAVGAGADALLRLLRAGASFGLLTEDGDDRNGLTDLRESLRSDAADSARDRVLAFGTPMRWRLRAVLGQVVRTGHTTSLSAGVGLEQGVRRARRRHRGQQPTRLRRAAPGTRSQPRRRSRDQRRVARGPGRRDHLT